MSTLPTTVDPAGLSIEDLGQRINAEHKAAEASVRQGIDHALRAGEMLTDVKARLKHGRWLPWLRENFAGSQRTARLYLRIWSKRGQIGNALPVSSLRGAAALLAEPKTTPDEQNDVAGVPLPCDWTPTPAEALVARTPAGSLVVLVLVAADVHHDGYYSVIYFDFLNSEVGGMARPVLGQWLGETIAEVVPSILGKPSLTWTIERDPELVQYGREWASDETRKLYAKKNARWRGEE